VTRVKGAVLKDSAIQEWEKKYDGKGKAALRPANRSSIPRIPKPRGPA
jgi:hypothetical protein